MIKLECLTYGVGHTGEGVCLLLRIGTYRILLDCGLSDLSPLLEQTDKPPADLVLCSHAHADHARGLLALHQAFPQLPIYASEVTTQLLPLNWLDETENKTPQFCHALPWRTPIEFLDGLSAEIYPSGHLPGAAAILLSYTAPLESSPPETTPPEKNAPPRSYTVLYTGDFSYPTPVWWKDFR